MSEALVVFDNVVKRFGDFVAVKRMNLEIGKGEFIAIMGPSGCGKTTTLRMLAGLESPTDGEIRLDGRVMNDVKPHERDTPMVWQSLALFPFLNAREYVEFGLRMRGFDAATRRGKALGWLDRLGMSEFAERDISTLSGGQKQRMALARALLHAARILVLDDPISQVDLDTGNRMVAAFRAMAGERTILIASHRLSAIRFADTIVALENGRIIERGTHRELMENNRYYARTYRLQEIEEDRYAN